MRDNRKTTLLAVALAAIGASAAAFGAAPETLKIELPRHRPCNLFQPDEAIAFKPAIKEKAVSQVKGRFEVADFFGRTVAAKELSSESKPGMPPNLQADIGPLEPGYYELKLELSGVRKDGSETKGAAKASFAVAKRSKLGLDEFLKEGRRFGMKWWGGVTDKQETLDMMQALGMQWTRLAQNDVMGVLDMNPNFAVVLKVERFSKELFDEERYGKLEDWEAKYGKGAWTLKTLPKKDEYQKRLAESVAKLPKEQNVFEIWNEPWDKMSPEDFATLCQWIAEVVLKARPDAIIGPNLGGSTSDFEYDAKVVAAGGMKGMNMVCLHPYGKSEDRQWLRDYREWISKRCGRDIAIYVTEYGSHSCPQGPAKRSEADQARSVVRQSLFLYAEGVKAFMPHWVGQSEKNPTYHEDWFGYIRRNQEPKPALVAYANCARMIDASEYLGDLWFGPGLDAMVFKKGGAYLLALSTRGEEKEISFNPEAKEVEVVDLMGRGVKTPCPGGELKLKAGGGALYVAGIGEALAAKASKELRPERWPAAERPRKTVRKAKELKAAPAFDGQLKSWGFEPQISFNNVKVAGDDASGFGWLAWDKEFLYIGIEMRDNEILNNRPDPKLYSQDSLEIFVSSEPRESGAGYGQADHQLIATPSSQSGAPVFAEIEDREAGHLVKIEGSKSYIAKAKPGWIAELAIPWSHFKGFKAEKGERLALDLRVNDADSSHERFKIDPIEGSPIPTDPSAWALLELE